VICTPHLGHTGGVLPAPAEEAVENLLARLDRAVPGRIEGFYVVGSACMGGFRVGRSDVDFVATIAGEPDSVELAALRRVHLIQWMSSLARDAGLRWRWPLVCNGSYVRTIDLSRSPHEVTPVAAHVAGRFRVGERDGFDINPVTWHTLALHGVAVRGEGPAGLRIWNDPHELYIWTLNNLNTYWLRWSERARRGVPSHARALPRRSTAGGVLGAPRLHYTLTTGQITDKEAAAAYALDVFEPRWHALIEDSLAFWRGAPSLGRYRFRATRRHRDAAEFVAAVIESANGLDTC
jgi:hypothetical protein